MATSGLLVGVDVGTSAVKVLAVTAGGDAVASASRTYPLESPQPGRYEQDPERVCTAALSALHEVLAAVASAGQTVAAIGLSCAMHGLLAVDAGGVPLCPLVTWLDERAAGIAQRWRADGTAAVLYAATGAPVHAMLPSCKLRYFAEFEPAVTAGAARFVSLKELLVFRLTGEWLVDYGLASGTGLFDVRGSCWNETALAAAGVTVEQLSTPAAPATARPVALAALSSPEQASSFPPAGEVLLVLGSSDGAAASLGVGATETRLALTLGTSGALRATIGRPSLDDRGRTFCYHAYDGRYITGGPTNSAGAALAALLALFVDGATPAARFDAAVALAETSPPGARGVSVMPFLAGERAPYWQPGLRGALGGLATAHSRADVLRAAFEGVVFGLVAVHDAMRERLPPLQELRLSGGLCRSPFLRQLAADAFGVDAVLSQQPEASAYGAAMGAGIALASVRDEVAVARTLLPQHAHRPNSRAREAYREAYERYRVLVAAQLATAGETRAVRQRTTT